jgi:sugar/nucleoside kinase (ribokinase family)
MFVIIGSVTADLFIFDQEAFTNLGDDGFRASNLVFTEQPLTILMGGNGGNSAYVLAGLGVPTALCGMVGRDPLGDTLVRWMEDRNINLAGLQRSPVHATSTSTIIMLDAAHQVVFHHLGATAQVGFEQIPAGLLSQASVLLCSSVPLMTRLRAGSYTQALATTHQAGGITAVDIGPAIGKPVTLNELSPLFPHLDYLLANSHELAVLTDEQDWEAASAQLLSRGAQAIVIKQGKHGASLRAEGMRLDVPGFVVEAHISVGAGDSFNVGFLYGVQQGWPLTDAIRFANAVAALVVSSDRGVLGSPGLGDVERFLSEHP